MGPFQRDNQASTAAVSCEGATGWLPLHHLAPIESRQRLEGDSALIPTHPIGFPVELIQTFAIHVE
jgi:hypothetical protein